MGDLVHITRDGVRVTAPDVCAEGAIEVPTVAENDGRTPTTVVT